MTASNITQDKETGIGSWTDEQIKKALRKGERPNGVHLAAMMPSDFYEILTPSDLDAIVAYLRTVKPVKQKVPDPIYRIALPRHILPGAEKPFTEADMHDKVKKGFYLATIGHCMECHTPMGPKGREFQNSLRQGRLRIPRAVGQIDLAQHHVEQEQGHRRLDRRRDQARDHPGDRKDGTPLKPPMGYGYYANMTDADLDAVVAYLRTVPAKE